MKTNDLRLKLGRLKRAPENFVSAEFATEVSANGITEARRGFLRNSFLAAVAAGASTASTLAFAQGSAGDPTILDKQVWQTTLGQPVAVRP